MNVSSLYKKLKQIFNDSNTALVNKNFNKVNSFSEISSEIERVEINKLPYLLRNEILEISEHDLNGCNIICNHTFFNCYSLTSIDIPDSVTVIEDYAFLNCRNLANITIPDTVISIGRRIFTNTAYYNNENNWDNNVLYVNKCLVGVQTSLQDCQIKDGTLTVADYAFESCSNLKSIIIPDSVKILGKRTFNQCTNLASVTLGDSITSIGDYTFYNCDSLTNVTIPDSVTSIGDYAFYSCDSLTSVTIGKGVTSIGINAFKSSSISDIYIHSTTPPVLTQYTTIPNSATIHVPIGSGDAYKNATNWSRGFLIVEDIVVE